MKQFYDTVIKPRSKKLAETIGTHQINVTHVPNELEVNVNVKYYFHEGNYKILRNGYIRDLKALGLI